MRGDSSDWRVWHCNGISFHARSLRQTTHHAAAISRRIPLRVDAVRHVTRARLARRDARGEQPVAKRGSRNTGGRGLCAVNDLDAARVDVHTPLHRDARTLRRGSLRGFWVSGRPDRRRNRATAPPHATSRSAVARGRRHETDAAERRRYQHGEGSRAGTTPPEARHRAHAPLRAAPHRSRVRRALCAILRSTQHFYQAVPQMTPYATAAAHSSPHPATAGSTRSTTSTR